MEENKKLFALVDCNSFFCSCERLFRPDLTRRPVGVLSNNDGCFVSRTPELKALKVPMGAPYFKYRQVCQRNQVAVFSANFSLYTNVSQRVMATLQKFAPRLEYYSIDEAFLDLSGFSHYELQEYGHQIKNIVWRHTGIPVSVGIGPSKTLAKAANSIAKKSDFHQGVNVLVDESEITYSLKNFPVGKIWGIGRQSAQKLKNINLNTALEFRDFKNEKLILKLLTKVGRIIQDELRGISCRDLEETSPKKKEIMVSRTFGQPARDLRTLEEAVANYASSACQKLRKQNSVCAYIAVMIRTNPHNNTEQYYAWHDHRFLTHTSDTRKVVRQALQVLREIYKPGYLYNKALVRLSDLVDREETQYSLFENADSAQSEDLMACLDQANFREGPGTLKVAACGVNNKAWRMKQAHRSPRYVSGWSELCSVR